MTAQTVDLASNEVATAGDIASVALSKATPFLPGREVTAHFLTEGASGTAPAYVIDGSEDDTVWVADIAASAEVGHSSAKVKCYPFMRLSITTAAGTPGTISCWLEATP